MAGFQRYLEAPQSLDVLQDPFGIEFWPEFKGRDGCRTPMPWINEAMGGFTSGGHSWLPVEPIHRQLAVSEQTKVDDSTLNFTRRLFAWRKEHPALQNGDFEWLESDPALLLFRRTNAQESITVAINMTANALPAKVEGNAIAVPGFTQSGSDTIAAYSVAAWVH